MEKQRYTITYSKKGLIKYISHLDMMAVLDKALRRSQLPVYITQGFNPKIKISFKKAHPVGVEVEKDTFSVFMTEDVSIDTIKEALQDELPTGLRIYDIEKN